MKITLGDHNRCIDDGNCLGYAANTHEQLSSGRYDYPASIQHVDNIDDWRWMHRTARKRAARAARLGYTVERISRAAHIDEIHAINTSLETRQGKAMTEPYRTRPHLSGLPDYPCPRHRIDEWGCFTSDHVLVAYLVIYVCGDLAMISQILGHGDHLGADVMYQIFAAALEETLAAAGPLTCFYNMHDSGTDGLRYFKERLGFQAGKAEWAL